MEPTDFERGFRAVGVLDTLKLTAEFLTSVRGRRKAVLFFSEGIDYPITDSFGGHSASDVIRATQDAITTAARANVNFYTIDPRGLVGMTNEFMEMAGGGAPEMAGGPAMRTPGTNAAMTGVWRHGRPFNAQTRADGRADAVAGQPARAGRADRRHRVGEHELADQHVQQIVQANSRYYVLGYYPPTHARNGRFHKIEVQDEAAGPARRGAARDTGRRAAGRRKSGSATKRPGARAKRNGRTPTRRPRSCATSSPAR